MKLKEYLDINGIQYSDFAKRMEMNLGTFRNILFKGNCRIDQAIKIEKLTLGVVTFKDLSGGEYAIPSRRGPYKPRKAKDKSVAKEQSDLKDNPEGTCAPYAEKDATRQFILQNIAE